MKTLMNYSAIVLLMIAFLGASSLTAQEWTEPEFQEMTELEYKVLQQKTQQEMAEHGSTVEVPYAPDNVTATGDDCSDPIVITASSGMTAWSDMGQTTCGRGNYYSNTCMGNYDGGRDIIYELEVQDDMELKFTFQTYQSRTGIAIMDACGDAGNCIIFKTLSSSGLIEFYWTPTAETYYIQVDTRPNPTCANFDLSIEEYIPTPADPITTFPYTEGFDDCTWPATMLPFAGTEAHAVVSEAAGFSGEENDCGALLDGDSYFGFWHSSQCEVVFDYNYPAHTAQIKMNYIPDVTPGSLQLDFDLRQFYSFSSNYSWFRVRLVDNGVTVTLTENSGNQCFQSPSPFGDWTQLVYDLSAYQTPGQNYELILDFVGKYYWNYYNGGDAVMLDNVQLQFIQTGNSPPVAACQDVSVSADGNCEGFVTAAMVDNGSSDPDGDPITLSLDPPGPYALGETSVTLTVTDDGGESDECTAIITVVDDTPPVIIPKPIAIEFMIWPPNHKYVTFALSDFVLSVDDNCTDVSVDNVNITKATSDEPEDAEGEGDGHTLDDIVIADDCKSIQLRKERQGGGNGRVYTIHLELVDDYDNPGSAICQVQVPHNIGETAIDDGPVYEVLGNCDDNRALFITAIDNENTELTVYPNPFNNSITIAYELKNSETVEITIYNHLGKQIELIQQTQSSGKQQVVWNTEGLPSGVYYCVLKTSEGMQTAKMIKLK